MRAVYLERSGGYDVLKVREAPAPAPKAGEVAIAVKAAGINFADILALDEAGAAHAHIEARGNIGKVILAP